MDKPGLPAFVLEELIGLCGLLALLLLVVGFVGLLPEVVGFFVGRGVVGMLGSLVPVLVGSFVAGTSTGGVVGVPPGEAGQNSFLAGCSLSWRVRERKFHTRELAIQ